MHNNEENPLDLVCCGLKVGQKVPDFKITTFEPTKGDFGEFSFSTQKKDNKRWTILFFYPADFTFV